MAQRCAGFGVAHDKLGMAYACCVPLPYFPPFFLKYFPNTAVGFQVSRQMAETKKLVYENGYPGFDIACNFFFFFPKYLGTVHFL